MGYIEGLLGGFNERKNTVERQNYEEGLRSSEREQQVLSHLINSPDPEIKALAISGMLESANPKQRKGGFAGWMGNLQGNPHLASIRALLAHDQATGQGTATPGGLGESGGMPTQQVAPEAATPAGPPLAQPGGKSLTEVGSAPPAPTTPTPPASEGGMSARAAAPGPEIPAVEPSIGADEMGPPGTPPPATAGPTGPAPQSILGTPAPPVVPSRKAREVFQSPEGQLRLNKVAGAQGDVEGLRAGLKAADFSDEEIKQQLKLHYGRGSMGATGYQSTAGEVVGADGTVTRTFGAFDRGRGAYIGTDPDSEFYGIPIPGFQPRATGTTQTPEEAAKKAAAVTTARGGAAAGVPLSSNQRFVATEKLATDWQKLQAPIQTMQQQQRLMDIGLQRFRQGDKIGGSQGVLVTFQRILDPKSVVRESEYARTPQGLGLIQRLEGMRDRLFEGGAGVPEPELAAMVETARQFAKDAESWNDQQRQRFQATATANGLDPTLIFGQGPVPAVGTAPPAPAAAAPATAPVATPPLAAPFTPTAIRPGRSGAVAPAPGAAPSAPPTYKDAQGNWHVGTPPR